MKTVAIIPARGGSKGISNKNIKDFCGKPLIAWAVEAALDSELIDRVIVSTDDEKIAEVARKYGAEVPFIRPSDLAQDATPIEPVLKHVVEWLEKYEGYQVDVVLLLLPTNPLRQAKHLDEAIETFLDKKTDSVISSTEVPPHHNPYWVFEWSKTKPQTLVNAIGQNIRKIPGQRQLLPKFYTKNDIVFVLQTKNLFEEPPNLYGEKTELYVMNGFFDADINTIEEWAEMERKIKELQSKTI